MKNFSERLEWAMANAKKTRKDLSLVIDASVQAIGQVLNSDGKKNFTAVNCAESAKYLGVDFYWLATGKGSPLQPSIADGLIEIEAASQAVRRLYRSQQSVGELSEEQFVQMFKLLCDESGANKSPSDKSIKQSISGDRNFQIAGNNTGDIKR